MDFIHHLIKLFFLDTLPLILAVVTTTCIMMLGATGVGALLLWVLGQEVTSSALAVGLIVSVIGLLLVSIYQGIRGEYQKFKKGKGEN